MLKESLGKEEAHRADLEEIHRAGERAAALTRQLLAFSRQQVLTPRVLDLNEIVAGIEKMARRLVGEHIELVTRPAANLGLVRADAGQLEQVLMNLVVNARDAMPEGGRISLETANVELDAETRGHDGVDGTGPHVMLAVSDTGTGMDPDTLTRIFEPFFTTKEQGKGTGLGLSTVFGIVKQSGGSIGVSSAVGTGSTFRVFLPRIEGLPPRARPSTPAPEAGRETVLLTEDEEQVRHLAGRVLRRAGYQVLEAATGSDAIALCERHGGAIHLLLTDVVMPQMSGRQLAERVKSLRPQIRVLYMSGYTANILDPGGNLDPGIDFLQKPLTPNDLLQKVRQVIDAPRSP
jgi:CheY-like chemotaxis protein